MSSGNWPDFGKSDFPSPASWSGKAEKPLASSFPVEINLKLSKPSKSFVLAFSNKVESSFSILLEFSVIADLFNSGITSVVIFCVFK